MKRDDFDPSTIENHWAALQKSIGGIAPIRTARQYAKTVRLMNRLLDLVGDNEKHPLADLLEIVGNLVSSYEEREAPIPDADPREVLRLLMQANGLTQADLREELGGQPVVSAILNGKRSINTRQARALAGRFKLSAEAFLLRP
jgi:HTH-type transcriptional regulator/antitoxin HigA